MVPWKFWPTARLSFFLNNTMEYRQSLPQKNDNVSHDQPVREFILLFFGITVFLLVLFWATGLFVDYAVGYITPEMEAKIFSGFSARQNEMADANDPRQAELQRMVDRLRECIDLSFPLTVHLVKNDIANAVALPGGRIIVFDGLLDKVKSENGLSFVLAHELAHFKNRDHLRGMGRGIVITTVAALITGAGSDITQLLAPTVNFNMARYSQKREGMADEEALRVLECYYGHVGGATEFFEAMTPDDKKKTNLIGHYFRSHPEALDRIRNLHRLAEELNFNIKRLKPLPELLNSERRNAF